jgi:hypothetical protein
LRWTPSPHFRRRARPARPKPNQPLTMTSRGTTLDKRDEMGSPLISAIVGSRLKPPCKVTA